MLATQPVVGRQNDHANPLGGTFGLHPHPVHLLDEPLGRGPILDHELAQESFAKPFTNGLSFILLFVFTIWFMVFPMLVYAPICVLLMLLIS